MSPAWPVVITPLGLTAVGTKLWRRGAHLRVTAIVSASFAFAPGGTMPFAEPRPLTREELHHGNSPMRSIRASGDLAPHLDQAGVIFVGHAYAEPGTSVPRLQVRLAVARGGRLVLDKSLEVIGSRSATPGKPPPEPKPFQKMPLVYERAFGGIGWADNPLGVGLKLQRGSPEEMPNLIHPDAARADGPAGYGPISWTWPARKALLHGHPRKALDEPKAELPADLDLEFFHASPRDQRIPHLQGDEVILLEGLHPRIRSLQMRLPGARALARLEGLDGGAMPIPLFGDTLYLDGDAELCTMIWRGSLAIADERLLPELSITAGVETESARLEWPTTRAQGFASPARAEPALEAEDLRATQIFLEDSATSRLSMSDFEGTQELPARPRSEDAPTKMLPVSALRAGIAGLVPTSSFEGTIELSSSDNEAAKIVATPFPLRVSITTTPSLPIPGAPWAVAPPSAPLQQRDLFESTMDIAPEDIEVVVASVRTTVPDLAPATAPLPLPLPTPPPRRAPEPAEPAKPAWSWAEPVPPKEPDPAPARPAAPKKNVATSLYGKFTRKDK